MFATVVFHSRTFPYIAEHVPTFRAYNHLRPDRTTLISPQTAHKASAVQQHKYIMDFTNAYDEHSSRNLNHRIPPSAFQRVANLEVGPSHDV